MLVSSNNKLGDKMNKFQKIVSEISGYNGLGEHGARNDYYYDQDCIGKRRCIEDTADILGEKATELDICMIACFLRTEFDSQDDKFKDWNGLG